MGDVLLDWEDPLRFPLQGVLPAVKDAPKEGRDGRVDLSAAGSDNEGSGAGGGGYICPLIIEYLHPVYRHSPDTGDIYGSRETAGGRRCQ